MVKALQVEGKCSSHGTRPSIRALLRENLTASRNIDTKS